jgi:hypothetical protein
MNFRQRWLGEVYGSHLITDSTRVVLLRLCQNMDRRGYVSMPRSTLAAELNRHGARITERIKLAKEAGFLDVVTAGKPGITAVYRAMLPAAVMVRTGAPQHGADSRAHPDGADGRTTIEGSHGAPGESANMYGPLVGGRRTAEQSQPQRRDGPPTHTDVDLEPWAVGGAA